jgi:quercetin dioxygenase-like cupin family protein
MAYFYSADERAAKTLFGDITAKTFWGEKMLLSLVNIPANSVVPFHSHPHEQAGIMIQGEATFTVGGETRLVKAGEMWIIPGGVEHTVVAGAAGALALDVFSPVREDYQY